jgi:opacity protein-like surface antigen
MEGPTVKKILFLIISSLLLSSSLYAAPAPSANEQWHGKLSDHDFDVGALGGVGAFRGTGGFGLLGTAAKEVIPRGFVPDIDDAVFFEVEAGPYFIQGGTDFHFSAHLRWDFAMDQEWTFYALGGVAGDITGNSLSNAADIYLHFGAGAQWKVSSIVWLRGEVSREFLGVGVLFPF